MDRHGVIVEIPTRLGNFHAVFSDRGLGQLGWPRREKLVRGISPPVNISKMAVLLQKQLTAYAEGRKIAFTVPLDFSSGTDFQQLVWKALARIKWGQWISYRALAGRIKRPQAARAVAGACAANPLPIVVPCHRVLRADGSIGGWSGPAGWKEKLLAIESVAYASASR